MVQNLKWKIIGVFAVLIAAILIIYFRPLVLGLDLQGGSTLRYQLPMPEGKSDDDKRQILETTVEIFKKRVDGLGLKEIGIRSQGVDEIRIDLPEMSEAMKNSILEAIENQGHLEWLLVAENESDSEDPSVSLDVDEKRKQLVQYLKGLEEGEDGGWNLNTDLSPLSFALTMNGEPAHYRWMPRSPDDLEKTNERRVKEGVTPLVIPDEKEKTKLEDLNLGNIEQVPEALKGIDNYFLLIKRYDKKAWQFSGSDIASVSPSRDRQGNPAVGFEIKPGRASEFAEFTEAHVNHRLAIILDGFVNSDPLIKSALPGRGIIEGGLQGFTLSEQKYLLTILKSGSLEIRPRLLSEDTIGPSLGQNSIFRGEIAGGVGLAGVFIFLIVYYLLAGFIASVALAINLIILMAALMGLEFTLTLPGIAGIVLTVGMAVDANILIFERIREEKDKGKTLAQAVKNGFERAFITIVDANVTTFITGYILFTFGTGPIQGFAVTLMIGICTSLFAALVVSKVIFAFLLDKELLKKKLSMMRFLKSPNVGFLKAMPVTAICSGAIIVLGLTGFILSDRNIYGLDFTGGFNVQVTCMEGTEQADVQTILGTRFPNVQVATVGEGAALGEEQRYKVFDVKIKSTKSLEEAMAEEQAMMNSDPGDGSGATPGERMDTAQVFLADIKKLLADRLIKDPIFDFETRLDEEKQVLDVSFGMNLEKAVDETTIRNGLGELLNIDTVEFGAENTVKIKGTYVQNANISSNRLQALIISRLKENASDIQLLDPFPLTGYIGPTVGSQLRDSAIKAILASLLAIIIYIRIRFKEYKYGIAATVALVHDVMITLGAVTAARATGLVNVEIDLPLIAAFLTIIGYSLNDTIVVFDRVRENLPRIEMPFSNLLNLSINQTLSRTLLTSLTTLLTVTILFVLNYGQRNVMEGFSFALIVGVVVGTYSSIFVASPVLILLKRREERLAAAR